MTSIAPFSEMQQAQFWRSYRVTVECGPKQSKQWGNVNAGASNLRIAFSAKRELAAFGAISVTLTNLNPVSRRAILAVPSEAEALEGPGIHLGSRVTVEAGYNGSVATVCIGHVRRCVSERSGADIHTHLELIDGAAFGLQCIFKASYAASPSLTGGVKLTRILRDITDTMQLTYPGGVAKVVDGLQIGLQEREYPRGISFDHTCADALRMLLEPQGLDAVVANAELRIIPRGKYDAQKAVILRTDTGLINTPSTSFREGRNTVLFQSLLNPLLVPGRLVQFTGGNTPQPDLGASLAGYYKILTSTHEGDSHAGPWSVSCEAERYNLPVIA